MPRAVLCGLLMGAIACTSPRGFDRGRLGSALAQRAQVTDEDIRAALALQPQLPQPFRLGILFREPQATRFGRGLTWRPEDKEVMLRMGERLVESHVLSDAVYVTTAVAGTDELKAARYAAAQHGADAVLVVSGVADTDRYNNVLGPLYALVVTGFFVPGTVVDGLFVAQAALWDVRNGFLYASVEADGQSSLTRPAFYAREEDAVNRARTAAVDTLAAEVEQRLQRLVP